MIDNSLPGAVNKIAFYNNTANRSTSIDPSFMVVTPQNNQEKKIKIGKNHQTVEQFFSKPYKCKKFKKFPILVDINQSSIQIPSLSNFLALKNGKEAVNKLFEEDLLIIKKLQRQKDVEKLRSRANLSYQKQPPYPGSRQPSSLQSEQSSSINQQPLNKQNVPYGSPPNYANYGDTFNKNTAQFVENAQQKKEVNKQNNEFQQYENYSRIKEKEKKYSHQNGQSHRTYKKAEQYLPETSFIKRHQSNKQEKLPDFADQSDIKARSPVYYSPRLGSEILQQDEYQTAQKSTNQELLQSQFYGKQLPNKQGSNEGKESTNKKYKMKKKDYAYEEERSSQRKSKSKQKYLPFKQALKEKPFSKEKEQNLGIMAMIKQNNKVFQKYTTSPTIVHDPLIRQQIDIKDYSSIVSNQHQDQALKEYFKSIKQNEFRNQKYKITSLVASINNISNNESITNSSNPQLEKKLSSKFNSQKDDQNYQKEESVEEIKSENQLQEDRSEYISSRDDPKKNDTGQNYEDSQQETVKSINYSVTSLRRPPPSIHISQTVQSIEESASKLTRPPLNKKRSTSRKKESSIARTKFEKDSILQKPPPSESQINPTYNENQSNFIIDKEPLKFDSKVYNSEYEQSVSQKDLQRKISELQNIQNIKLSEPQININPPLIANTKSSVLKIGKNDSKLIGVGGNKLKSLQEARSLAKQSKKKSVNLMQNDQSFRYEQKMSQLQSFLTRKEDSVVKQIKEDKRVKLSIEKSRSEKRDIMNLLDELENQSSYREDFESYREETERF